jgi:hypothetical protein
MTNTNTDLIVFFLAALILIGCNTSKTEKDTKGCKGRNVLTSEFSSWPLAKIKPEDVQKELLVSDRDFSEDETRRRRRKELPELIKSFFPDRRTVTFDEKCPLEFNEAGHDGDFYFSVTCGTNVKNPKAKRTFYFLVLTNGYSDLSPDDDSIYFRCSEDQYWHNKQIARILLKTKKGTRFTGTFGVSHLDNITWLLIDRLNPLP